MISNHLALRVIFLSDKSVAIEGVSITPGQAQNLAIEILNHLDWTVEKIGTQMRAYAPELPPDTEPEPELKQYPSKAIVPEE